MNIFYDIKITFEISFLLFTIFRLLSSPFRSLFSSEFLGRFMKLVTIAKFRPKTIIVLMSANYFQSTIYAFGNHDLGNSLY